MSDDSGEERAQRLITAALSICASGRQTASTSLCDEAQKQLKALWEDRKALRAENARLTAEVERLRDALRPFAEAASDAGLETDKDYLTVSAWEHPTAMAVTVGDFYRARAALGKE